MKNCESGRRLFRCEGAERPDLRLEAGDMEEEIGAGHARAVMRRKRSQRNTSVKQRRAFLDELAQSCNVRRAAAVAGFAVSTAYKIRRRDPLFAEHWQAALCEGYVLLENLLVQSAIETMTHKEMADAFADAEADGETGCAGKVAPPPAGTIIAPLMTITQAIDLLNKHRASVAGGRAKTVRLRKGQRPSAAETDDYILRKIAVIERQRAKRPRKDRDDSDGREGG